MSKKPKISKTFHLWQFSPPDIQNLKYQTFWPCFCFFFFLGFTVIYLVGKQQSSWIYLYIPTTNRRIIFINGEQLVATYPSNNWVYQTIAQPHDFVKNTMMIQSKGALGLGLTAIVLLHRLDPCPKSISSDLTWMGGFRPDPLPSFYIQHSQ